MWARKTQTDWREVAHPVVGVSLEQEKWVEMGLLTSGCLSSDWEEVWHYLPAVRIQSGVINLQILFPSLQNGVGWYQ